jgi:glucose/arabinose dehydrogenase
MNKKLLVLLGLTVAMALSACDSGQPTATPGAQPTVTITGTTLGPTQAPPAPSAVPTKDEPLSVTPTIAAPVTNTPSNAGSQGGDDGPLKLSPVTIETNDTTRKGAFESERTINLPQGFHIQVYAQDLGGVRWLGLSPEGVVYATLRAGGQVVTLPDADKDGVGDDAKLFADGLPGVHGIAFKDEAVYVATEGEIIRLEDTDKDGVADKRDVLASDLPTGEGHFTRTIAFGPDGKLYVSVGSSCNVCKESNEKRASISRYSADGKFEKVYASGLRNAVGIVFHPLTSELWATNNGRDNLGDDLPPETIYDVKEDTNYGWPYCYGNKVPDKTQNVPAGFCEKTGVPAVEMQAHSAPLGLAFYMGDQFPAQYKGDLFVAFHGSWNRTEPTGFKVVRIRFKDNQPDKSAGDLLVEDFATGWLVSGSAWGRPVDPMVAPDGSLLVTDDKLGAIYRIYYQVNAGP